MTEPTNYEKANSTLDALVEQWADLDAEDRDRLLDGIRNGAPIVQARALLAVADELKALRELLAERLTKPTPITVNYGQWRLPDGAVLTEPAKPLTDEERAARKAELDRVIAVREAANPSSPLDKRLFRTQQ